MATTIPDTFSVSARGPVLVDPPEALGGSRRTAETPTPSIFNAASKSAEFSDRLRCHYRETRRIPVEIACNVELILMDGSVYDSGSALLRNVSPSGALVTSFSLEHGAFPAALFKLRMILNGAPYQGIGIEATPVRFAAGAAGLGVKFDEIFIAV